MSTPINLNKARKARARAARKAQAEQNTVAFGRSKAEKDLDKAQAEKAKRAHDGHKRDP